MTALQDGRILIVLGGHAKGARGINNIVLFDPDTLTWTPQPSSPMGRYYPTSTLLPNGTVVISGGFDMNGAKNPDVELWTPPQTGNVGSQAQIGTPVGPLPPPAGSADTAKVLRSPRARPSILDPEHLDPGPPMPAEAEARQRPGRARPGAPLRLHQGHAHRRQDCRGARDHRRGNLRRRQPDRRMDATLVPPAGPRAHESGPEPLRPNRRHPRELLRELCRRHLHVPDVQAGQHPVGNARPAGRASGVTTPRRSCSPMAGCSRLGYRRRRRRPHGR